MSDLLLFQREHETREYEQKKLEDLRYDCSLLRRKRGIFRSPEENITHQEEIRLSKEDSELAKLFSDIETRKKNLRETAKFSKLYNSKGKEINYYTGDSMVSWYLMDRGDLVDIVNDNYAWGKIDRHEYSLFMRVVDDF